MKTALICIFSLCASSFVSCSAGPVYIAKNETEGIKTSYQDPGLSDLCAKYRPVLDRHLPAIPVGRHRRLSERHRFRDRFRPRRARNTTTCLSR